MSRIVSDINRHLAFEVLRGKNSVAFVGIAGDTLALQRIPIGEFDAAFPITDVPTGENGTPPSPRHYARVMLRSKFRPTDDALVALLDALALGDDEERPDSAAVLAEGNGELIATFVDVLDAGLAAKFYRGSLIVKDHTSFARWPAGQKAVLTKQVCPGRDDPIDEELFIMAKAAKKPAAEAPKKVEKVTKERAPKGDGPIAQVANYIKSNLAALKSGKLTRKAAAAALRDAGINKGTVGVQLTKQLAALGVEKPAKAPKAEKPAKVKKSAAEAF